MAIVSVNEIWLGRDAKRDSENKRTYMRNYRVVTDDPSQSAQSVREAVGIPTTGTSYAVGTDFDTGALVVDINARQGTEGRLVWYVEVTYSTKEPGDGDGQDGNGNPTDDPVAYYSKLRSGFAQFTGKIYKQQADDPILGAAHPIIGINKPIWNSAKQPFRPPWIEVDDSHLVVTITRNQAGYDASVAENFQDALNDGAWGISYLGFQLLCSPRTAKMQNIGCGDVQFINGIRFREVVYEIHVKRDGWAVEALDHGMMAKVEAGGNTGTPADYEEMHRVIVDANGIPISEPVLLKDGKPLRADEVEQFLKFHVLKLRNFNILGLP